MAMDAYARRFIQNGLLLSCVLFSGCRWIPLQRSDSKLDALQFPNPPANANSDPLPPPVPLDVTDKPSNHPPTLKPLANSDQLATEIAATTAPASTPLLDQAYARAVEIQAATFEEQHPIKAAVRSTAEDLPLESKTVTAPSVEAPLPKVDTAITQAAATITETNIETISPAPDVAEVNLEPIRELSLTAERPHVPIPITSATPQAPESRWEEGIQDLLGLAREQAVEETEAGRPGLWSAREQLLARLTEADDSVWKTVLESLAEPTADIQGSLDPGPEAAANPSVVAKQTPVEPELTVVSLTFCKKVEGFGNFEPVAAGTLKPGKPIGLYWEVEGLVTKSDAKGHHTKLSSAIEVVDESGTLVWSSHLGQAEDTCRRPRRDYFVNTRLTLPDNLKPGTYQLRLKLEDIHGKQQATDAISFSIQP